MEVQTRTVTAADGRKLSVEIGGDPAPHTILVHNGSPNCRHLFGPWVQDAATRGARLMSYDRPGYGGSTPQPDHSVADGAADVRAIAAELGIERLAVWGLSGGGPYALACAALLPDLVVSAAAVASIAPWDSPGLDFFDGMGKDNEEGIKRYFDDPEAEREELRTQREELLEITPEQIVGAWDSLLSPVDAGAVSGDFAEWLVRGLRDGLAPGGQGWWDDGVAHLSPWGFDLGSIRVPVKIWHGRHDRFVPFQHGEWLARHVGGAEAELTETDGHLTLLIDKVPDVQEWLLAHF
jgi:pimeloyl-ACP methyl ester carboxylesterase